MGHSLSLKSPSHPHRLLLLDLFLSRPFLPLPSSHGGLVFEGLCEFATERGKRKCQIDKRKQPPEKHFWGRRSTSGQVPGYFIFCHALPDWPTMSPLIAKKIGGLIGRPGARQTTTVLGCYGGSGCPEGGQAVLVAWRGVEMEEFIS